MDGERAGGAGSPARADLTAAVTASLVASLAGARRFDEPYRHWMAADVFPPAVAAALRRLPFPKVDLHGVSGKRELHNDERHYFDALNNARFAECAAVADAFQSPGVVEAIDEHG